MKWRIIGVLPGTYLVVAAHPVPGVPGRAAAVPWWAWFAAAVVLSAVLVAVLVARSRPSPGLVAVSVGAGSVSTVVFDGPPGQLSISGATHGRQVTLTGQVHWAPGHRAAVAIGPHQ